ncbi:hypothetical protein I7I48_03496 [Histoplasma ohiense]|nr:hypothetical protein I7I48_03496 [Histoplasma ohiense (nom. inval.)]
MLRSRYQGGQPAAKRGWSYMQRLSMTGSNGSPITTICLDSSVTSKPSRKRQYPKPHPSDRSRFQKSRSSTRRHHHIGITC